MRQRLSDIIGDAITASVQRVLAKHPERRDELADWLDTYVERVKIVPAIERRGRGTRIDTRSLRLDVYVDTSVGRAPLCSVRVRDLCDRNGAPIDAQHEARTLLLQHGHGIPDDLSSLTGTTDEDPA